jgi:hypothetical protein
MGSGPSTSGMRSQSRRLRFAAPPEEPEAPPEAPIPEPEAPPEAPAPAPEAPIPEPPRELPPVPPPMPSGPLSLDEAVQIANEFGIQVRAMSPDEIERELGAQYRAKLGLFNHADGSIILNTKYGMGPQVESAIRRLSRSGFWSSGHRGHLIHHELGHALHRRRLQSGIRTRRVGPLNFTVPRPNATAAQRRGWSNLSRRAVPSRLAKIITREVSKYATTNRLEIVSEMYAGMRGGKHYSPRLMRYYRALGGEVPAGH